MRGAYLEKVKRELRFAKHRPQSRAPYGYRWVGRDELTLEACEAAQVERLYKLVASGRPGDRVSLTEAWRIVKPRRRCGSRLTRPGIYEVIHRPLYMGVPRPRRGRKITAPRIVTPALWRQAQAEISHRRKR